MTPKIYHTRANLSIAAPTWMQYLPYHVRKKISRRDAQISTLKKFLTLAALDKFSAVYYPAPEQSKAFGGRGLLKIRGTLSDGWGIVRQVQAMWRLSGGYV
ncbi:MAG: hypothetical protein IKP64_01835 [Selenomonadaceae bacterium]|nr:hypothetical protein [Selenomonadaceae bacterium]